MKVKLARVKIFMCNSVILFWGEVDGCLGPTVKTQWHKCSQLFVLNFRTSGFALVTSGSWAHGPSYPVLSDLQARESLWEPQSLGSRHLGSHPEGSGWVPGQTPLWFADRKSSQDR